jgi:alpha/beta hydrolase fold
MTSYQLPARTVQRQALPKWTAAVAGGGDGGGVSRRCAREPVPRSQSGERQSTHRTIHRRRRHSTALRRSGLRSDRRAPTGQRQHDPGFESSGVLETAARKYRVIVFDRPGFGYSARPRGIIWTPEAQAELIHRALQQIGVQRGTVLGHSWGDSVALALAMEYPKTVAGLVLASGYYYPSLRADVSCCQELPFQCLETS